MSTFFPCEWPIVYPSTCSSFTTEDSSGPAQSDFEQLAIGMLWNWTGRVFGTCQDTVRPCKVPKPLVPPASSFEGAGPWPINPGFGSGHSTIGWWGVGAWMPVLVAGNWYNILCGTCNYPDGRCNCQPDQMKVLSLPGPVISVDEVEINGVPLDPSTYWVRNKRWLTRSDGQNWALTQDLTQPDGSQNTWSVSFTHGVEVPPGGDIAAGTLACELAKAWAGDNTCALPQRMQTISREGVTIMMPREVMGRGGAVSSRNAADQLPKSNTGIWAIDSWVDSVNIPRYGTSVRSVDTLGTQTWKY